MTFYYNDSWLGYLSEKFVRASLKHSQDNCPGCRDNMSSALLHLHHQMSLLEKLRKYFEEIRGDLLSNTTTLYTEFEKKLPHSDDLSKDKMIYLNVARHFLLTSNAETLYYGRYITDGLDSYIAEAFTNIQQKKKKKTRDTRI